MDAKGWGNEWNLIHDTKDTQNKLKESKKKEILKNKIQMSISSFNISFESKILYLKQIFKSLMCKTEACWENQS